MPEISKETSNEPILSQEEYLLKKNAQLQWFLNKLIVLSENPVTIQFHDYDKLIYFPVDLLKEESGLFPLGVYPVGEKDGIGEYTFYCLDMLEKIKTDIPKLGISNLNLLAEKFSWIADDNCEYGNKPAYYIDCDYKPLFDAYLKFLLGEKGDEIIDSHDNNVIWKKTKKKQLHLPKLPNDLKWEDVTIRFLNGDEVQITAKGSVFQSNAELMGFQNEKNKRPTKQWDLLKILSYRNGFLDWNNNGRLDVKTRDGIKKQKQELSEKLCVYFHVISGSPFFDYREEDGYKIKMHLIPEQGSDLQNAPDSMDNNIVNYNEDDGDET